MTPRHDPTDAPRFDRSRRRVLAVLALALAMDGLRRTRVDTPAPHATGAARETAAARAPAGAPPR